MFDWFGISGKRQHEQIIQDVKKNLILQRRENCKDDQHSITIIGKRRLCKMLGCHLMTEQKAGRGYQFIHVIMCERCDYVRWVSQNYHNYDGHIHTDCLENDKK